MNTGKASALFLLPAFLVGCAHNPYVDPAAYNPVSTASYTRAETMSAGQRLVNIMLADPVFAQHYSAKCQQRNGVPVLQMGYIENLSTMRNGSLEMLRGDIESALRASGRFVLSGDLDACDYVLRGEYRNVRDGGRMTHNVSLRLHDIATDMDVWMGKDEIAKE